MTVEGENNIGASISLMQRRQVSKTDILVQSKDEDDGADCELRITRQKSIVSPDVEIELYRYEDAPPWLQHNHHIRTGYRRCNSYVHSLHRHALRCTRGVQNQGPALGTLADLARVVDGCRIRMLDLPFLKNKTDNFLKCLLIPHNETINIWSHLIGFGYFFVAMATTLHAVANGELPYGFADTVIVCLFLLCCQASMFFSATFHLFNCCSPRDFDYWLSLDFLGIALGTIGCYFPGLYFAFNCHEHLQAFYTTAIMALTAVLIWAQLHPDFGSDDWSLRRNALFGAVMLFGVVPALHWVGLHGLMSRDVQEFLPELAWLYGSLGAGFLFYISRFPERLLPGVLVGFCGWLDCTPSASFSFLLGALNAKVETSNQALVNGGGKLDVIGHSHQWWHVLMLAGLIGWHRAILRYSIYMIEKGCTSSTK